MTREKLDKLLREGEGFTIEFKECANKVGNSVYETVCSFSNRYGGHILLGVKEEGGRGIVCGVDPGCVAGMKKDFVNALNNPQKITPSLYLSLEEFDYDGKTVLWVYVPITSQVEMCGGRIYDRNGDADQDVTTSSDLVTRISNRKSATFLERKVFPYATMDELCVEDIKKARQMAINRYREHPWGNMDDMTLLKSAGLYEKDQVTGKEGFNMACILLFGKPEVIMSCVPGYMTDAIYRVRNLDRYDDRLIVEENLIKSYSLLMGFIMKHTDDRFFLIDNARMDVRSAIARELVSNILVHRDFGSAFTAKVIIEKDRIRTENWSRTQRIGRMELEDFTPYSKNPLLAKFFMNIGYADGLGSGVRNLYKYTKIYSGGEPVLEEGDIFRVTVPLDPIESEVKPVDSEPKPVGVEAKPETQKPTVASDPKIIEAIKAGLKNSKYRKPTKDKIHQLCNSIEQNQTFDVSEIAQMTGCTPSNAYVILRMLHAFSVIKKVKGNEKGRYVFTSSRL